LPKILAKLLPGLLPLSNKAELRTQVLTTISMISRRIKSLSIPLPCAILIDKIVRPDMMPFACNITLSLIDISLANIDPAERMDCALAVLNAIELFGPNYYTQTNALLNYSLQLLPEIAKCFNTSNLSPLTREHVWAWILDVTLVQAGLKKDAVGSIQPGLSAERVARLTAKTEGWFLPHLSQVKLEILNVMAPSWMNFRYIAAIVMVCVCDSDVEVSKQAVHKLNGLKSSINNPPVASPVNASAADVVVFLLRMCIAGQDASDMDGSDAVGLAHRIQLRVDVRAAALRWIRQEASECVPLPTVRRHALGVVKQVFAGPQEGASPSTTTGSTSRYQAAVMEIADIVSTAFQPFLGYSTHASVAGVEEDSGMHIEGLQLTRCCLVALNKFMVSSSSSSASGATGALGSFHEDDNMAIRKVCEKQHMHYCQKTAVFHPKWFSKILFRLLVILWLLCMCVWLQCAYGALDRTCRAFPGQLLSVDSMLSCAVPLVSVLFRLMEWEHDANLSRLLAALGSLRIAFREHYQHADAPGILLALHILNSRDIMLHYVVIRVVLGWCRTSLDKR
jgi:hypothetical protein